MCVAEAPIRSSLPSRHASDKKSSWESERKFFYCSIIHRSAASSVLVYIYILYKDARDRVKRAPRDGGGSSSSGGTRDEENRDGVHRKNTGKHACVLCGRHLAPRRQANGTRHQGVPAARTSIGHDTPAHFPP